MEPLTAEDRPAHRPRAATLLVLAAAAVVGCTPSPNAEPVRSIDRVARRLEASAFPQAPTPRHGPVAQIGDEARTVVLAPQEVLVAESFGVVPKGGRAEVEIELDEHVADLPDGAFVLSAQELPFTQVLDEDVMARVARENFSLRRDRGWRLRRDGAGRKATLEVDHEGAQEVQLNLRLTALLPVPESLESEAFEISGDSHVVLGFGLTGSREVRDAQSVAFEATLSCAGRPAQRLVRRRVSLGDDVGWQDVDVPVEGPASDCRLLLSNEAEGGRPRGAVWAAPQILASEPRTADDTNLVLISLDTLRADHLSGFGYARETSPVIDHELIDRGTTFTDVSSTFPQTDISHLSMFTGLYPSAQPKRGRVSPHDRLELLAELLQRAGLETAAFTEDALVSGAFGFWFGFDQFTERSFAHADRGRRTFEDGIRYLEGHADRRFFLFLHTYKTHDPYVPGPEYEALWSDEGAWRDGGPAPWVPGKHREILDRYDRTIREADALVGGLLDTLSALGIADRTFVVLTSDHGEAFGEHGIAGHGFTPHQEALDVPLILRGPGVPESRRIDSPVSVADVTPTLLELLGAPAVGRSQGISLAPALGGATLDETRPLFFSWLRPEAAGVRRQDTKYYRTTHGHEQFDLASDPHEWKPDRTDAARTEGDRLLAEHEAEAARLRQELGPDDEDPTHHAPAIDQRLEKSLEALGYL